MSIYLGDTPLAHNAVSRNIGEIIQSTIPLNDAGLHLLDGALISGAGSYGAFVTYIAGLVSSHPDLFTTETAWQQSITDYGVCGKFVYDSTNNTVRLPKITGFVEGTTDVTALGNLVEAGLPNIISHMGLNGPNTARWWSDSGISGALYGSKIGSTAYSIQSYSNNAAPYDTINFDASRSNSIYGNSSTVQPQSIKVLYYIVIANSVKTNIEVDIDEIATDLNEKADVDASNLNNVAKSLLSGLGAPSSRYADLTLGASGTSYTAPATGYVHARVTNSTLINILIPSTSAIWSNQVNNSATMNQTSSLIKKGTVYRLDYGGTLTDHRFIYAEGEENV